jgi:hypothetical protein
MSNYRNILDESYYIYKKLSSKKFNSLTLTELLFIPNFEISLWTVFSVGLTINCFPRKNRNLFLSQLIGNFKRLFYFVKRKFYFNKYFNKNLNQFNLKNNILFLSFNDYLAKENFIPICEKLLSDKILNPLILTEKTMLDFGLDKKYIFNLNQIYFEELASYQNSLNISTAKIINDVIFEINKCDLTETDLLNLKNALNYIKVYSEKIIPSYVAVAFYMLKNFPPKVIISIDIADPRTRIFTLIAKKFHIPVIQLQAGPIDEDCIEWFFFNDDYIFVNGPLSQTALQKFCISDSKILSIGSAKHEAVLKYKNASSNKLRERFNLKDETKIVLLLSSYLDNFQTSTHLSDQILIFKNIFTSIINGINKGRKIILVIKPHPLEKIKNLEILSNKNDRIYIANKNENTTELISCADAVFTFGSTSTIDSLLLGKFTICPKFEGWVGEYFQNSGAVAVPKDEKEIEFILHLVELDLTAQIIESLKESRLEFLKNISTDLGIGSINRIVQKIYRLSDNKYINL